MKSNAKILEQRRKSAMERERAAWFKEGYVVLRVNARLAGFPADAMVEYRRLSAKEMYAKRALVAGWIEQWEKEAEKGQPRALPFDWLSWGTLEQRQADVLWPAQVLHAEMLRVFQESSKFDMSAIPPWKVWKTEVGQIDNFQVFTPPSLTDKEPT